jgi:hypothetical protein
MQIIAPVIITPIPEAPFKLIVFFLKKNPPTPKVKEKFPNPYDFLMTNCLINDFKTDII